MGDAVAAIARNGENLPISKVAMRLTDEDCFVRTHAVVALGRLGTRGDTETLALLDEMFDDGFVPVRKRTIEAVQLLATSADEATIKRLKDCIRDRDAGVRTVAKTALDAIEAV